MENIVINYLFCWRHTVPKLKQDGNTMTEIFLLTNTIRRKQERAQLFRKATRLRETIALPLCSH